MRNPLKAETIERISAAQTAPATGPERRLQIINELIAKTGTGTPIMKARWQLEADVIEMIVENEKALADEKAKARLLVMLFPRQTEAEVDAFLALTERPEYNGTFYLDKEPTDDELRAIEDESPFTLSDMDLPDEGTDNRASTQWTEHGYY